jgi:DHA2 family multidrug resistance protein-like MFS transporter
VLGISGATLAPSTLSLIRNMFLDPRQRTMAISVWISSYSVGGAIGPLLGGILLQHFGWGSVFLLGVPMTALLLVVGPWLLPEYRDLSPRRLDLASALLSMAAMLAVIYGMKDYAQGGSGWRSAGSVAAGVLLAFAFARRQRRLADPLLDLRLFRGRAFGVSLASYLLASLVALGSYVFIGQYLQLVLGLTPLVAGLWTLPWSAGFIIGSTVTPALARRARPAFVMAGGMILAALGFAVLTRIGDTGITGLVTGTTLLSLGVSPVVTLGTDLIVGAAPPEGAGAAAAISETSSELGGALGIAILGSIGTAIYRGAMANTGLEGVPAEAQRAARDSLGGATAEAAQLPLQAGAHLLETARAAFGQALQVTVAICAVISALTAVLVLMTLRRIGAPSVRA